MRALFEFARSEIIALPFFDERAFFKSVFKARQLLDSSLYPHLEDTLCRLIPGVSLEHLQHMRDEIWFQTDRPGEYLFEDMLRRQASIYLEKKGDKAVLKTTPGSYCATEIWRWLVFALPPDLLLAAGWDDTGPRQIDISPPEFLKQHQIAQTHVHLGAATDFNRHWCGVQHGLTQPNKSTALADTGAPFDNGQHFLAYLTVGAICRILLGCFLNTRPQNSQTLIQYIDQHFMPQLIQAISVDAAWTLRECLWWLYSPETCTLPSYPRIQNIYHRLAGRVPTINNTEELWKMDPALRQSGYSGPGEDYEIYWQRQAFTYLSSAIGQKDELFQGLFWQCIRLKVMYYRYVVQRPMVKGLGWFIRFYGRIKRLHRPQFALQQAFLLEGGQNNLLKSYEFRMGPDKSVSVLRTEIHDYVQSWLKIPEEQRGQAEVGCVIHIPKQRGPAPQSKALAHHWQNTFLNPDNNSKAYRLSRYFNQKQAEIQSLSRLLQDVPLSLAFIRGFDMCTDETGIPNWFMAALFLPLKEAAQNAFQKVSQLYPEFPVKEIRQTMHVGEDFHHLLDGIRRMDEVLTRFPLTHGDRIGHGLALGISPQRWAEQHPVVWMPRETRLWDLIWAWKAYQNSFKQNFYCLKNRVKKRILDIEKEILKLSEYIFGFAGSIKKKDVFQLYEDLFDAQKLFRVGFPNGEVKRADFYTLTIDNRSEYWLYTYLTDNLCFQRCYEVIKVENTEAEIETLQTLQRVVRQRICKKNITIEVNPSSNFLIGDLQNLAHHPLWNLYPPPGHKSGYTQEPVVKVCLGSDDPLTFGTHLPQEYALLYSVLQQKGVDKSAALNWVSQIRQNGLKGRFTLSFGDNNQNSDIVLQCLRRDLKKAF